LIAFHRLSSFNSQSFFPVDMQEIRRIVELMNEHGLTLFDLTKKDFHLKLKKGVDVDSLRSLLAILPATAASGGAAAPPAAPTAAPTAAPLAAAAATSAVVVEGSEITSPMVGTFYLKPAPEAPNFIEVGSMVSIGQVVCVIEAMKVMNEIKAEQAGIISAIIAEDGGPVQYGDVLFRLK
jgi:acetyl-CoA carboxylase biotin carboxyl carrier protein